MSRKNSLKTCSDDELTKLAVAEIERDTKIAKIRSEISGSWARCPLKKANKRFLNRTIINTLAHNNRQTERHRAGGSRQLEQLDRAGRYARVREKFGERRHTFRSGRNEPREIRSRSMDREMAQERARNARRKAAVIPRIRPPLKVSFVKPADITEQILLPGGPKKIQMQKVQFVMSGKTEEQFLTSKTAALAEHKAPYSAELLEKVRTVNFVAPENEEERFFSLSRGKVGGLIKTCN